jgi:hypothetical protein
MMNSKGFGRNRSWPNCKVLSQSLRGRGKPLKLSGRIVGLLAEI